MLELENTDMKHAESRAAIELAKGVNNLNTYKNLYLHISNTYRFAVTTDYRERIKRRLPAGYDQLFSRDDIHETDSNRGSEAGPPTIRPGPADNPNTDNALPETK